MIKPTLKILTLFLIIGTSSCVYEESVPDFPEGEVEGFVPVYIDDQELGDIKILSPKPVLRTGKLLLVNDYLLINEKEIGVHIIDNSNPSEPKNIGLLNIPGNIDVAVKGNYIYADNYADLVTIEIVNDSTVRETNRIKNVFSTTNYPSGTGNYFECVDPSKGTVVAWRFTKIENPKCYK